MILKSFLFFQGNLCWAEPWYVPFTGGQSFPLSMASLTPLALLPKAKVRERGTNRLYVHVHWLKCPTWPALYASIMAHLLGTDNLWEGGGFSHLNEGWIVLSLQDMKHSDILWNGRITRYFSYNNWGCKNGTFCHCVYSMGTLQKRLSILPG